MARSMTPRDGLQASLLLLLSIGLGPWYAFGCSDVMLSNTTRIDAIVSGRHLDWYPLPSMALHMLTVPAGTPFIFLPDAGCSSTPAYAAALQPYRTAKYGYIAYTSGFTAAKQTLKQLCPDSAAAQGWFGTVYDGMNSAGFSAASLTQRDAPAPSLLQQQQQQTQVRQPKSSKANNGSSSSSSSKAISGIKASSKINLAYADLVPLLLGNYRTVAEAVAAVTPDKFRMVSTDLVLKLEQAIMGGKKDTPVLHTIIHDAQGATAVLEFSAGPDGLTTFTWKANPSGVTANAPKLEQQLQFVQDFKAAAAKQNPGGMLLPGHCTGPTINDPTAPWCDSVWRFSTLYILKDLYGHLPHPEFPLNPLQAKSPAHTAYGAVMHLLNRVTVPGSWPSPRSNTYASDESTMHQIIRDHRSKTLFMRHYGNMQWVSFNVATLTQKRSAAAAAPTTAAAATVPAGVRVAPLQAVMPVDQQWAVDRSQAFMAASA